MRLSALSRANRTDATSGDHPRPGLLSGLTVSGGEVIVDLGSPGTKVALFLTSSCYRCEPVWSHLRRAPGPSEGHRVIAVVPDPAAEDPDALRSLAPEWLEVVMSTSAWLELCPGPAPWLITSDGPRVVYSGPAPSSKRKLRRLLRL